LLPISQNTALFSLLGTYYGGDGRSTFALPDLQGCAPMHPGDGPGLSSRYLGESAGSDFVQLSWSEMPQHSHALRAATQDNADVGLVSANSSFAPSTGGPAYRPSSGVFLADEALRSIGDGQPHNNMMPYLTLYFCIALQGEFPPRS
jgi:microcystin-dependent protein